MVLPYLHYTPAPSVSASIAYTKRKTRSYLKRGGCQQGRLYVAHVQKSFFLREKKDALALTGGKIKKRPAPR
ncbi:MAG TPA: hypothetical protein QF772_12225 [Nitrospinaceae bacterium]|jgi:hypothetical protein|nr:hypothetical protein [Nitrospinaceae bacterium]